MDFAASCHKLNHLITRRAEIRSEVQVEVNIELFSPRMCSIEFEMSIYIDWITKGTYT